jgi:hypothetical protein
LQIQKVTNHFVHLESLFCASNDSNLGVRLCFNSNPAGLDKGLLKSPKRLLTKNSAWLRRRVNRLFQVANSVSVLQISEEVCLVANVRQLELRQTSVSVAVTRFRISQWRVPHACRWSNKPGLA